MSQERLEVGQLIPTSATPPSNAGIYSPSQGVLGFTASSMTVTDPITNVKTKVSIGSTVWKCGLFFILFHGDGGSNGLIFNGAGSGAFTLSAGIANFIPHRFCAYLPADQSYSGSAAGWYYGTMSSATAGVLYAETYDPTSGIAPVFPSSPTALPVTKLTRLTQTTSEITFMQVPAPAMLANDLLRAVFRAVSTNTAGTKTLTARADSTVMWQQSWTTTSTVLSGEFGWQAAGSADRQVVQRSGSIFGQTGVTTLSGNEFKNVDLSGAWLVKTSATISANTEMFAVGIAGIFIT